MLQMCGISSAFFLRQNRTELVVYVVRFQDRVAHGCPEETRWYGFRKKWNTA